MQMHQVFHLMLLSSMQLSRFVQTGYSSHILGAICQDMYIDSVGNVRLMCMPASPKSS